MNFTSSLWLPQKKLARVAALFQRETGTSLFDASADSHTSKMMTGYNWFWMLWLIIFIALSLHHDLEQRFTSGWDEALTILFMFCLSVIFWVHWALTEWVLITITQNTSLWMLMLVCLAVCLQFKMSVCMKSVTLFTWPPVPQIHMLVI